MVSKNIKYIDTQSYDIVKRTSQISCWKVMGKLIVDKFLAVENFLRKKSSKNVFYAILATFLLHPFPLNDHSFSSLGFQDWQLFIFEVHGEEGRGGGHQILVWLWLVFEEGVFSDPPYVQNANSLFPYVNFLTFFGFWPLCCFLPETFLLFLSYFWVVNVVRTSKEKTNA